MKIFSTNLTSFLKQETQLIIRNTLEKLVKIICVKEKTPIFSEKFSTEKFSPEKLFLEKFSPDKSQKNDFESIDDQKMAKKLNYLTKKNFILD